MFKCALGRCRLEVCLVFMLCISEFSKYCSLLFDTNASKESIYCDINGKMFNSLNKFLLDSVTTPHNLLAFFCILNTWILWEEFPKILFHKSLEKSLEKGMVNHNNSIWIYIRLNRSNCIASSTQFVYWVVYVWF